MANAKADVLTALDENPDGLSISQLLERPEKFSRRSLNRWLPELTEEGKVIRRGPGRGLGVIWASVGAADRAPVKQRITQTATAHIVNRVPLSPAGQRVADYVSQPTTMRTPVRYQHEMLDDYVPNETFYLDESRRRQLHLAGRTDVLAQPAGTYGRSIMDRLLIDLSYASSHLEGNTYSLLDTRDLIEKGSVADGRNRIETQMILNHKGAIEFIIENSAELEFDAYTVRSIHGILSEDLLGNKYDEGRLRQHAVGIGGSVYEPLSTPQQIEEQFETFLSKVSAIADPFEQSLFAMVHIPYLQPFADMNKRTSRIAANVPLLRANLVPMTFLDVPIDSYNEAVLGVYELFDLSALIDLYMWAYPRSARRYDNLQKELVQPDPLRVKYRDTIKSIVRSVVLTPETDANQLIDSLITPVPPELRNSVNAMVNDELRNLHQGTIARYNIRPSEFQRWEKRSR